MSRLINQAKIPLRLMPMGGSITYGQGSSDGNGYRSRLHQMLVSDGYEVNMVGSRNTGSMESNAHEGWRGFRIDEITKKAAKSVPRFRPNIIVVNAGSNDCLQDFDLDRAGERVGDLLECLWEHSPDSTVLLSTLLVNTSLRTEMRILRMNEQLSRLGETKIAEKKSIVIVDMHGDDGPQICDLSSDGVHPNDVGYEKMAEKWYQGVQEAADRGLLRQSNFAAEVSQ